MIEPKKSLFPVCKPYHEAYLNVSSLHEIWYAEYGNPEGVPVIVIHGGPGAGCGEDDARYFDPAYWRIILLDQRAAKRSKPFAEMQENTTQHLVSDLELLRKKLAIDKWLIFGGSWGTALGIVYGETHPTHVLGFILRGIFLGRKHENLNLWYGMGNIFPEAWQKFNDFIPSEQQNNLISAYHQLVMSSELKIAMQAAQSFLQYDMVCSFLRISAHKLKQYLSDERWVLGVARTFIHYAAHDFFLKENELLENLSAIHHLPLIIIHGRYDVITLPKSAYELHRLWPDSELVMVEAAGHSAKEKPILSRLVYATEKMRITLG